MSGYGHALDILNRCLNSELPVPPAVEGLLRLAPGERSPVYRVGEVQTADEVAGKLYLMKGMGHMVVGHLDTRTMCLGIGPAATPVIPLLSGNFYFLQAAPDEPLGLTLTDPATIAGVDPLARDPAGEFVTASGQMAEVPSGIRASYGA